MLGDLFVRTVTLEEMVRKKFISNQCYLCCRKVDVLKGKARNFVPELFPKSLLPGLWGHQGEVDDLVQYLT